MQPKIVKKTTQKITPITSQSILFFKFIFLKFFILTPHKLIIIRYLSK